MIETRVYRPDNSPNFAVRRPLQNHLHVSLAVALLSSFLLMGCTLEPFESSVDEDGPPTGGGITVSLVDTTADVAYIAAHWSAVSDPSGILHYEWVNWRSTPDTVVAHDSTTFLADTFVIQRPPPNEVFTFGFRIRAVDLAGNAGNFSQPHMWSFTNSDTVPPDTIIVDTIAVWPADVTIAAGGMVQFYVAYLYDDGSVSCETPPAESGALYDSGTFCCGCDSALAVLDGLSNAPGAPVWAELRRPIPLLAMSVSPRKRVVR